MSGRDDPRAGHPNGRPHGKPAEMPADLAAVQADDVLLDMLGSAGRIPGNVSDIDGELTRVLEAWRREVHADSDRLLVDADTALAVISAARRPSRRRNPIFGPVAAAAAVMVIAFSSVGLLAKSAQPGDNLWGVTEVLYSDYARSVETAASVRTELEQARTALRQGKPEQAKASLDRVQKQLPVIAEAEGKTDLTTQHRELERSLDPSPPAQGAAPGSPDASSTKQPGPGPSDPSSGNTGPSTQPDLTTSPESPPSSSPKPTPSPSPEPTPSPSPQPYPVPPKPEQPTRPQAPTPPAPDEQPTQPNAKPIRSSPSDFTPPAPPSAPPKPQPPSGMGMSADSEPSVSGDLTDPDPGHTVEPV
ncbi:MAG: anti-sigma-D factor RsdA [Pseudonocardiaceae bacterium]